MKEPGISLPSFVGVSSSGGEYEIDHLGCCVSNRPESFDSGGSVGVNFGTLQ
jgi:hypothetical protein